MLLVLAYIYLKHKIPKIPMQANGLVFAPLDVTKSAGLHIADGTVLGTSAFRAWAPIGSTTNPYTARRKPTPSTTSWA